MIYDWRYCRSTKTINIEYLSNEQKFKIFFVFTQTVLSNGVDAIVDGDDDVVVDLNFSCNE